VQDVGRVGRPPGTATERGVRVGAPAEAVWPWVAPVRLAPYSYDWIDNRGRRGRTRGTTGRPRVRP